LYVLAVVKELTVERLDWGKPPLFVTLAGEPPWTGVAGLDILRSGSFVIDYRRQRIIFGPVAANEKAVHFEPKSSS
jgi:hypothetical protein